MSKLSSVIANSGFPATGENGDAELTHRQLLGRRLFLNSLIRYGVAVGFVLSGLFAGGALRLTAVDVSPLVYVGILIAIYNTPVFYFVYQRRQPTDSAGAFSTILRVMYGVVVLDFLSLAAAVYLLGGARSPFMAFYLLHVALSCILMSRRAAVSFTTLAYALIVIQVLGEWQQVSWFVNGSWEMTNHPPIESDAALATLVVYGALLSLMTVLLVSIAERLRRDERMLRLRNRQLDELSSIRRDFLHVALHNVKSPIGATMMLLENLTLELAGPINEKQRDWLNRCANRLGGLSELLRDLQLLGELKTEELAGRFTRFDLRPMLLDLGAEYTSNAASCGHELHVEIPQSLPCIEGIERLIREGVINYLTNAIKYTPANGQIILRAGAPAGLVRIEVEDSGAGIEENDQHRLFDEFHRANKAESMRRGIPGTGLGLSIVKRIATAHQGQVGFASVPGKGCVFYLELPISPESPTRLPES